MFTTRIVFILSGQITKLGSDWSVWAWDHKVTHTVNLNSDAESTLSSSWTWLSVSKSSVSLHIWVPIWLSITLPLLYFFCCKSPPVLRWLIHLCTWHYTGVSTSTYQLPCGRIFLKGNVIIWSQNAYDLYLTS